MNLPVLNGQLPQGFCPSSLQETLNGFSAAQFVDINEIAGIVVSSTPPAEHDVAWLQLDSSGRPVRLYYFAVGAWLSRHPLGPGFTMIWPLTLPDVPDSTGGLPSYDGGDANARSVLSGPMWQLCNTKVDGSGTKILTAQYPLGVGAFPTPSTKTVAVQDIGGEETHQLTLPEMFPHAHAAATDTTVKFIVAGGSFSGPTVGGASSNGGISSLTASVGGDPTTGTPPVSALGHNNLPPYVGVYFLQRTSKEFYIVNP